MFWLWLLLYGLLFAVPRALMPAAAPLLTPALLAVYWAVLLRGLHTRGRLRSYGLCRGRGLTARDALLSLPVLLFAALNAAFGGAWPGAAEAVYLLFAVFGEEVLFRGVLPAIWGEKLGAAAASAALFALLHLGSAIGGSVSAAAVQALCAQQQALETRMNAQYQDMLDYYTLWAHQIKTPIASMRLCLQQEDTPQARRLLQELSRAEQYVEMVMVYLRLTGGSDLVLRECQLDGIVRRAVRRFAGEFIGRKLKLCYEPLNVSCVTDEKWLLFVIEQVLSNALKYTRAGSITIELEAPKTLVIRDTGIGVAPEDLPRIFEKGYTGYNGRGDQKASGLGLYLCRTICKRLGHTITASSVPDHGTAIRITLEQRQVRE